MNNIIWKSRISSPILTHLNDKIICDLLLNGGVESIMSKEKKDMLPISREKVEVEGLYTDEWGRSEYLYRGQEFPADLIMGSTEWKLTELADDPAERDIADDFENTGHSGKRRSGQVE